MSFAINFQTNIINICKEIIEKKKVKQTKHLRYALIESDQSAFLINTSFYCIDSLANLLLRIHNGIAEKDPENKHIQPFVFIVYDKVRNVYFVHGTYGNTLQPSELKIRKK